MKPMVYSETVPHSFYLHVHLRNESLYCEWWDSRHPIVRWIHKLIACGLYWIHRTFFFFITWCKEEQIDSKWCNCYPRVTWWTPVNSPHQLTRCCIAADAWQWGSRWIMGIFLPTRSILFPRRQIPVTESTFLVYTVYTSPAILYNLKLYKKIVIFNMHYNWYWHDIFTLTLKHMYLRRTVNRHNAYHYSGHNYNRERVLTVSNSWFISKDF
jgi:hypothetical protein